LRSAPSEIAIERMEQSIHDIQIAPAAQEDNLSLAEDQSQDASVREILLQMKQIQEESSRDHLIQMRQLLVQEEIGASLATRAFDWMTCKPARLFHPVIGGTLPVPIYLANCSRNGGSNLYKTHPRCIKPTNKEKTFHFEKTFEDISQDEKD